MNRAENQNKALILHPPPIYRHYENSQHFRVVKNIPVYLLTYLFGILPVAPSAWGAAIAVTDRTLFASGDVLDWDGLGVPGTITASNSFALATTGGIAVSVSKPSSGGFMRMEQQPRLLNPPPGMWRGNFAQGDPILYTNDAPGPVTIDFGIDVLGAGLQIQASNLGAFTATVQAFSAGGISLGTFSFSGNSFATNDNTAIFVGAMSSTRDIRKLIVNAPGGANNAFAMNRVSFAIPEPTAGSLLALGAAYSAFFWVVGRGRRAPRSWRDFRK